MHAILYARFSPRPNEELCESADKQLERCRAWCRAMNHTAPTPADEFKDEALSGASTDDRPALRAAIDRAAATRGILVVTAIDRLARDTIDLLRISREVTESGAAWASVTQSIDTSTPTGRFMVTVFAALAQMEREQIAERTKIGMRRLQAAGWAVSKRLPTGRRLSADQPAERVKGMPTKALRTEPEPAELVALERARELRASNHTWRSIAAILTREGHRYRGEDWKFVTIYRLLRS